MNTIIGLGASSEITLMDDPCRRFDALIARADQLSAEQAAELEAHLAGCTSCRELAGAVKPMSHSMAFAVTGASDTVLSSDGAPNTSRDLQIPNAMSDRYRITGEVGRGGIGRVLRALDQVLDRTVALKEPVSANDGTRRRFVREAMITARLQHPSIVPVYDAGHLGDLSPFYAMKLVAGRPLDKSIADAKTLAQRLALLPSVLAVADAMAYAHSERIIHRDLKPQNVLVGNYGETIVIDWGLAKDLAVDEVDAPDAGPYRAAASLERTVAGVLMGTPAYMAPEQANGEPIDERADVYALGAILYHVVSGTIPHEGTTLEEVVHRVSTGDVRPLTKREPDVPRDLAAIVTKAMAVEPSARYANAEGLADDLRRFLNGQLVGSHSYRLGELVRRWIKRHRAALMVALGALVVVSAVGIASVVRVVRAGHQADDAAAVAIQERNIASARLADIMVEQGRQELLAGRPARAAVYLSEAQANSTRPVALRSLLAEAMRSLDAQQLVLDTHAGSMWAAAFSADGTRIVTGGIDGKARVWDAVSGKLVATLTGHRRSIHSVAFSPDDARIATAGIDHTARLWDARTGTLIATLEHADKVHLATFSPDGGRLVTTGDGGIVELWDAKTAHHLVSFVGLYGEVRAVAFSPDGTRVIAAGEEDHAAMIWDANTGARLLDLEGHAAKVFAVAFSPDGSEVITASGDFTARLWNSRTGTRIATLVGHTGAVVSATFSADGTRVITTSHDGTARVWDARTGAPSTTFTGHTLEVQGARFSPDGTRVVTASGDGTAKLWDVATGRLLSSYEGHRKYVVFATFSPDGTRVLTASMDGTARLWDATPSKLRVPFDTSGVASGSFSPDAARLVTTSKGNRTATIWDVRSGKRLAALAGHEGEIIHAEFDATGARVVTTSADHTAKLWDAKTGTLLFSLPHDGEVRRAAFAPEGDRVVTAGADGARLWSTRSGQLIAKLGARNVISVNFSKTGRRVVTATAAGPSVWSVDNGARIVELADVVDVTIGNVVHARLSDDGERVVNPSRNQAKIWDVRTGKLLATLDGHTQLVSRASFSHDGARVVTAGDDNTAKLWDARSGKLLLSFEGHMSPVVDAMFSSDPGGERVVTLGYDNTVRVWDTQTGKLLATLDGHTGFVVDVAFTPDEAHLVTAGSDGTSWIFDVHLEQRDPDTIHHIVGERDPWMLSDGSLVPIPAAPR